MLLTILNTLLFMGGALFAGLAIVDLTKGQWLDAAQDFFYAALAIMMGLV